MHAETNSSHWVFGYGSLIWRPGFAYASRHKALLRGAHRSLCVYSHHYRGTPQNPGLVFGLVRGGSCRGMAFRVEPENWLDVRTYLLEREQISGVYHEAIRPIQLSTGERVEALTFLVDEAHDQYAGRLDMKQQFECVQHASGHMGPNVDYVVNTARHLKEMNIGDGHLEELSRRLLSD